MSRLPDSDGRTEAEKAYRIFVVATDAFMSGWGQAPGRSLYAVACPDWKAAGIVEDNMRHRSEMKRVRTMGQLPRKNPGDHMSVAGPTEAPRFFEPGGFR